MDNNCSGGSTARKPNKKGFFIVAIVAIVLIAGVLWFLNRQVDVSFDSLNGKSKQEIRVKYNQIINTEDIAGKDELGDTFIGWFEVIEEIDGKQKLADEPFDFTQKITKNCKLVAVYKEQVIISFDTDGGTTIENVIVDKGSSLKYPQDNPVKDKYNFVSWVDKQGAIIEEGTIVDNNITLYAKYEAIPIVEESIKLNKSVVNMIIFSRSKLVATVSSSDAANKTVRWSSSDPSIISVDQKGELTANKLGSAKITAKLSNGKKASAIVYSDVESIALTMTYELAGAELNWLSIDGSRVVTVSVSTIPNIEDREAYEWEIDGQTGNDGENEHISWLPSPSDDLETRIIYKKGSTPHIEYSVKCSVGRKSATQVVEVRDGFIVTVEGTTDVEEDGVIKKMCYPGDIITFVGNAAMSATGESYDAYMFEKISDNEWNLHYYNYGHPDLDEFVPDIYFNYFDFESIDTGETFRIEFYFDYNPPIDDPPI